MRLEYANGGEWIQPLRKGYKLCCCDCGLVHKFDFRVYKGAYSLEYLGIIVPRDK